MSEPTDIDTDEEEFAETTLVEAIENRGAPDEHIEQLALHATLGRAWVKASSYQEQAADRALAQGAYRDAVLLNAAAALIVAGKAGTLREGAGIAAESIDSGAALRKLEALMRALA